MSQSIGVPDYAFRRSHDIKGSVGGEQTDYQVKIKVLYGGESSVLDHVTHIGHYEGAPANPIIAEEPGEWDAGMREIGNVLYEPEDTGREYKAFYSGMEGPLALGKRSIGYAYSSDGKNWTKSVANPVITHATTWYEDPHAIKVGDTYYLFCEENVNDEITMFHSADCETWINDGTAINVGAPGSWDDLLVGSPTVWKEGVTWYMLYEGMEAVGTGQIGLATSPDGAVWTKDLANPVMTLGAIGEWDDATVVCDDIVKIDGTYYLSYHGEHAAVFRTGIAHSTDLYTWTHAKNPLIYPQLTANPYTAVDHFQLYWDGGNNEWVSHYCDSRLSDAGWSDGLTNGIYRGYPRCTGDMFVCLNEKCRTDFGDIRFRQGATELDYWIQEKVDSEYAIFWVEIPTIPADPDSTTIHIYYGKANATTTENGADTWIDYEDWESYDLDDVLPLGDFEATLIQEVCKIDDNQAYKGDKSLFSDDDSAVNKNDIKWNYADKLVGGFRFLIALYQDTDYGTDEPWYITFKRADGTREIAFIADGSGNIKDYYAVAYHDTGADLTEDTWSIFEVCAEIGAATWDFKFKELRYLNRTCENNVNNFGYTQIVLSGGVMKFRGNLGVCCIGLYVDPEPTHEDWGAEEVVSWPF